MQYGSQPIEQYDIEHDLRELMPYLFSDEVLGSAVDDDEHRIYLVQALKKKYGEGAMGQIYSLINRLIGVASKNGRIKMRQFPEPMFFHDRRVAMIAPHVDRLACRIDEARDEILETIIAAVDADKVPRTRYTALLLLTLTLDDRITGGTLLRSLLGEAYPIRIAGRPFLARMTDHTVRDECIPIGYSSARVLAAASRHDVTIELPADKLPPLYARACTHVRQHHPDIEMPRNLTMYLSALRHAHAVSGIPALVHSRDHDSKNAALPVNAVHRLITGRVPATIADNTSPPTHMQHADELKCGSVALTRWVCAEAAALNWARLDAILGVWISCPRDTSETLDQLRGEQASRRTYSLAWLLLDWLIAMVTEGYLQTDIVRARFRTAVALLGPYSDSVGHYIEDGVSWESFYANAAAADDVAQKNQWDAVRAFHDYLVAYHSAGTVDWESEAVEQTQRRVDNNVVTPADYQRARRLLGPHRGQRVVDNAYIMLILGYRLGLRFSEARKLEIRQVEDAADPWVHVRINRWLRSLKSESRRIPMDPMLPPVERDELLAWRRERIRESGGDGSAALISAGPADPAPMSEARLRPLLADTLASATGDSSVRYHHLRHSCATWLLVRLLRPVIDDRAWSGIAAFDDDDLSRERSQEYRDRLLLQSPGQEAMWVVSQILGHVSPAVTRRSYMRGFEWLALAESWSFRDANAAVMQRLFNVRRSWAFEIVARWGRSYGRRATQDWPDASERKMQFSNEQAIRLSMRQYAGAGVYVEMVHRCECAIAVAELPEQRQHQVAALTAQWDDVPEVIDGHLQMAAQVQARYRTAKGHPRFGYCVQIPRSRAEQYDLEQWLVRLAATWEAGHAGTRMRIGRILAATAISLSRDRSSIRFQALRYARRHVDDQEAMLGIDRSRVLVMLKAVVGEGEDELRHRCRTVAKSLRVAVEQVRLRPGAKPAAQDSGIIEISVQAPQSGSARGPHQARRGSEAYRALVHYALIRAHELRSAPHQ